MIVTCLKVSPNLHSPQLGSGWVGDVKVPSCEQLVTKIDGFALPNLNVTFVVRLTHPVTN